MQLTLNIDSSLFSPSFGSILESLSKEEKDALMLEAMQKWLFSRMEDQEQREAEELVKKKFVKFVSSHWDKPEDLMSEQLYTLRNKFSYKWERFLEEEGPFDLTAKDRFVREMILKTMSKVDEFSNAIVNSESYLKTTVQPIVDNVLKQLPSVIEKAMVLRVAESISTSPSFSGKVFELYMNTKT